MAIEHQLSPEILSLFSEIEVTARKAEPVSLENSKELGLLQRFDRKYIAPSVLLPCILSRAAQLYKVLTINNIVSQAYKSRYYDTEDFSMYLEHHNGKTIRYKIRVREYLSNSMSFLEIKRKDIKGFTLKERMQWANGSRDIMEHKSFIEYFSPYKTNDLNPSIDLAFHRITLMNHEREERITLDYNIHYINPQHTLYIPSIALIEVKSRSSAQLSPMHEILRGLAIRPGSFSKYCTGIMLNYPGLKNNQFKLIMQTINKLNQDHAYPQPDCKPV
jgi:hypothetical protein